MHTEELTRSVQKKLAELTGTHPQDWFLVFRARQGIEVVLTELRKHRGSGEVITQPFTCVTAVNPIVSAGHVPAYIDTSPLDLSLDTSKLEANPAAKAIVMQHSFGIECAMAQARRYATAHDLLLIEDSAHQVGLLARAHGAPLADISIHSFGVEKILPTKFGGAVWLNPKLADAPLRSAIATAFDELPVIDRKTQRQARSYRFFNRILNHVPTGLEAGLRRLFISTGLFQPAITSQELLANNQTPPQRPDAYVLSQILKGFAAYDANLAMRREAASVYAALLPPVLLKVPHLQLPCSPVRFPVLASTASEATRLFEVVRRLGHYSGKWYRPTLFPVVDNPQAYNYDRRLFPVAEDLSGRILNLPTNITAQEAKEIVDALRREAN